MVLNPGTIVNTEREVILLKAQLKALRLVGAQSHFEATPDEETEKRQKLEAVTKMLTLLGCPWSRRTRSRRSR